jgi:CubicO group peptidase (beta-lactamase class C family)
MSRATLPHFTLFGLLALLLPFALSCRRAAEWPESSPAEAGLDTAALTRLDAHIAARLPHVRSFLVARRGRLVFEKYYGGAFSEELQNIQSMTKSISSALLGIALRKRQIASLDGKVLDYFPEYRSAISDPRMADVTIRHLLTMSSGIEAITGSFDRVLANPIPDILRRPLLHAPGAAFRYSDLDAHLLGGVLTKAAGMPVLEFAQRELFGPLGIQRFIWYGDNAGIRSGGLSGLWRARDVLKLGELYLRKGNWNGAQLISPEYVADSTVLHATGDFFGERARYGYMWWIADIPGYDAFYARGYGGQYLMVIPKLALVVLCTSDWRQPEYPSHYALVEKFLLPSLN